MKEIQILNNGDALYDIRRKINENFELVHNEATTEPLVSFGVNEGNETNGVADLIEITEDTLNFKVGGEYPNLVITSGDGVTTRIENVNPLYLQNLADGEYKVVVNGSNSNITDAEFYSQLLEPENADFGDVWFNGENATTLTRGAINVKLQPNTNFSPSFFVTNGNTYLAGGQGYRILRSIDGGATWGLITYDSEADNNVLVGGTYHNGAFYLVGTNRRIYKTETSAGWSFESLTTQSVNITKFKKLTNNFFVVLTTQGTFFYSTDMVNWNFYSTLAGKNIIDMVYFNGKYYAFLATGEIYTSADISNWEIIQTTIASPACAFIYKDYILVGNQTGGITIYDPINNTTEMRQLHNPGKINHFHLRNDGGLLILGSYNICCVTYDLQEFTQLYETGGTLTYGDDDFIIGSSGFLLKTIVANEWVAYPYIPIGEVIISGGEVTYFTTYPYNTNGLFEATSSTFGLLRTAAEPDELNCHCQEAVLTPANLYNLNNYRTMNTSYEVDQKVGCPYHHNLQLNCIQAGTTSNEGLNTKGLLEPGTTIEDGTVIWEVEELGTGGGGLEIGDIGIAPLGIDETQGKRRYLNGQLIIQDQYVEFTNKVKSAVALHPSLACTEAEWQTTATMTVGGQVGKFVIDDEAGTIRLPKIIMPIQGLTDLSKLGEIVEAGLPNITGNVGATKTDTQPSGAFYYKSTSKIGGNSNTTTNQFQHTAFDAFRSNPIYGNSDTVQQEQIQYPYFIQVATGAETEDNIINEIELNNPYSFGDSKYSPKPLNNLSWLKSEGQYNSKAVYPAYYDWALTNFNNGVEGFALSTGEYTDYDVVINTAEESFRLPLLDGSEDIPNYNSSVTGSLPFTVIKNGWMQVNLSTNNANTDLKINDIYVSGGGGNNACNDLRLVPVFKGDIVDTNNALTKVFTFFESTGNGSLYYYVGETVQNANLINAGRIEEIKANKTDVDGRWTQKIQMLSQATAIGNYAIDLSDYLPKDGYDYEVQFECSMSQTNSALVSTCWIGTFDTGISGDQNVSNSYIEIVMAQGGWSVGHCTLKIDSNKVVYCYVGNNVSNECNFKAVSYRRLGTNR